MKEQPEWMPENPFAAIAHKLEVEQVAFDAMTEIELDECERVGIQERPMFSELTCMSQACDAFSAGCQQTARKIAEWGQEECKEHKAKGQYWGDRIPTPIYFKRFECPECMDGFRKDVGL